MRALICSIGVSLAAGAACGGVAPESTTSAPDPDATTIIIDRAAGKDATMLDGYNTNMLPGGYGYGDEDLLKLTAPLGAQWFRFPGGTVANFYDWELRGLDPKALSASKSRSLNERNERQFEALGEKREGKVSIEDFVQFRSSLGARAVAVVNVFTGTPEKSAAWVRFAKEKGYAFAGWELGNEMYLPQYRNRVPSPQAYIESAKKHARAMRAVDPSIKLAVPVHAGALGDTKPSNYAERWNAALAADPFYDAYAMHPYVKIAGNFPQRVLAGDFSTVAPHLFALSQDMLTRGLAGYETLFGGRSIWFTEWNIMDHDEMVIAGTRLHALFVGDFFTLLASPTNHVDLAAFHVLAGAWNGYPLLTRTGKETSGSVRRPAYGPMLLIGESLQGASRSLKLSVNNAPTIVDSIGGSASVPGVVAAAFERGPEIAVLVSNRSSAPVTLDLRLADQKPLHMVKSASYVGGDLRSKALFQKEDVQRTELNGATVRLAPLSFTLLIGR